MADLVQVEVQEHIGTIDDNLNAVEQSIRDKVAEYSMVVVTEDSIADGKKFLAGIRKEKKSLESELREIKKRWMTPYDEFAKRAKQIIALYDEPEKVIDAQLAAYEEDRKKLRRQEIQDIYDHTKGDYAEWLPLEKIYNSRWENKGTTGKQIREDMEMIFGQLKVSISTVESLKSEFESDALDVLRNGGTLSDAMARIAELQSQKARFEEKARREAEEKLRREEEERRRAEQEQQEAERRKAEQERLEEERKAQEAEQNAQDTEQEAQEEEKPHLVQMMEQKISMESHEDAMPFGPIESDPEKPFPIMFEEPLPFAEEKMYMVKVTVGESRIRELEKYLLAEDFNYEVM